MTNKNDELVLECIKTLTNSASKAEAIKFAEHNQTCYDIAMAVAQAKSVQIETEKQALISKACEWLSNNIEYYTDTQNDSEGNLCEVILEDALIRDFRNAMKGE